MLAIIAILVCVGLSWIVFGAMAGATIALFGAIVTGVLIGGSIQRMMDYEEQRDVGSL